MSLIFDCVSLAPESMPSDQNLKFDWSQSSVFLQDSVIYYSPNSHCTMIIPLRLDSIPPPPPPFDVPGLHVGMFKQPVWWTEAYGWMVFVPLAPFFISTPFYEFCWTPGTEEVDYVPPNLRFLTGKHYRMNQNDLFNWAWAEKRAFVSPTYSGWSLLKSATESAIPLGMMAEIWHKALPYYLLSIPVEWQIPQRN
ncbi:hypothetical protein CVT25_014510 [Psilocybe cyanescens]|uniref:Uncharacterized protein n=1 Tax=Psilocybe cyanescens TaxID=93625 RepID=A0A409X8W8_PSICY|nr:hypothetical protein CVT25_014510 [Psilocybe cyanescens]